MGSPPTIVLVMGFVLASASFILLKDSVEGQPQLADTHIAFASTRDGNMEIYVMDADGSNPVQLTNPPGDGTTPSWSPANPSVVSPGEKLPVTWGEIRREGKSSGQEAE